MGDCECCELLRFQGAKNSNTTLNTERLGRPIQNGELGSSGGVLLLLLLLLDGQPDRDCRIGVDCILPVAVSLAH